MQAVAHVLPEEKPVTGRTCIHDAGPGFDPFSLRSSARDHSSSLLESA